MSDITYLRDKNIPGDMLNSLFSSVRWSTRARWTVVLEAPICVVSAWYDQKLVGFGRLFDKEGICYLYDLVVDPAYQRRGIGESIIITLEKKAKGLGYSLINTDSNSKKAQKLFKKNGYLEVKRVTSTLGQTTLYKKRISI